MENLMSSEPKKAVKPAHHTPALLKKAAKPLVDFIKESGGLYTMVTVDADHVRLWEASMGSPTQLPLPGWIQRLEAEVNYLDEKIHKLSVFLVTGMSTSEMRQMRQNEIDDLHAQLDIMNQHKAIVSRRLTAAKEKL
jgi:hypothetical protein